MEDEYLTVKEFASRIKMHYNTVIKAIKKRRIQAIRLGNGSRSSYRIPSSELNRIGAFDLEIFINKIVEDRLKDEKRIP